jgi:hypothetical protein
MLAKKRSEKLVEERKIEEEKICDLIRLKSVHIERIR